MARTQINEEGNDPRWPDKSPVFYGEQPWYFENARGHYWRCDHLGSGPFKERKQAENDWIAFERSLPICDH